MKDLLAVSIELKALGEKMLFLGSAIEADAVRFTNDQESLSAAQNRLQMGLNDLATQQAELNRGLADLHAGRTQLENERTSFDNTRINYEKLRRETQALLQENAAAQNELNQSRDQNTKLLTEITAKIKANEERTAHLDSRDKELLAFKAHIEREEARLKAEYGAKKNA